MNQVKIPFKQLSWRDNTTEFGKEKGLVYFIGELYESEKHRYPFLSYNINNNYDGKLNDKLLVYNSQYDIELGEFETLFEAKNACQKHLEETIIKTFFEL
jgi:hypothetical protein